jgi:hypothetical protein
LLDESRNEVHAILNLLLAFTISLFSRPQVWSAVSAVAEVLVANYDVSFDQVREIIEKQAGKPRSKSSRGRNDFEAETRQIEAVPSGLDPAHDAFEAGRRPIGDANLRIPHHLWVGRDRSRRIEDR